MATIVVKPRGGYTAPFEATVLHADDALTTPLAPDFRIGVAELLAVE